MAASSSRIARSLGIIAAVALAATGCVEQPSLGEVGRERGPSLLDGFSGISLGELAWEATDLALTDIPVPVVANEGQFDRSILFQAAGGSGSAYFTSEGVTFSLLDSSPSGKAWNLEQRFVHPTEHLRATGGQPLTGRVSYFTGQPSEWRTGLPTYGSVRYGGVWPGIDVIYSPSATELKYRFIVHPGADPHDAMFSYRGARSGLADGRIRLDLGHRSVYDQAPIAWQTATKGRHNVPVKYSVVSKQGGVPIYGFEPGRYRKDRPLVIDPAVTIFGGFIGGEFRDDAFGVAVGNDGSAYVVGNTVSSETSFPVNIGPDTTYNDPQDTSRGDAFVAKLSPDGATIQYAGFIGGAAADAANAVAVDAAGNAYVAGSTRSDESTFPVLVGPDLTYNSTPLDESFAGDAFITKVDPTGTSLLYSGYLGGYHRDSASGVALDAAGAAYLTGTTSSADETFPVAAGPDTTYNGSIDAFLAKVSPGGATLSYCGFIGGEHSDYAHSVAVGPDGDAYVVGETSSGEATFPVVVGPDMTSNPAPGQGFHNDAFITRVNASGTAFVYSGYIGGTGDDTAADVAVDQTGAAYVVGSTSSTESTFPVTAIGPDQTHDDNDADGGYDGFIAKVTGDGTALIYAGYLGGTEHDDASGVAVDAEGRAYVTGSTESSEDSFPLTNGPDSFYDGGGDAYVMRLSSSGAVLEFSGYVGGNGTDYGADIAVDSSGAAYIVGSSASDPVTFPVKGAFGPDRRGSYDGFVVKTALVAGGGGPGSQLTPGLTKAEKKKCKRKKTSSARRRCLRRERND